MGRCVFFGAALIPFCPFFNYKKGVKESLWKTGLGLGIPRFKRRAEEAQPLAALLCRHPCKVMPSLAAKTLQDYLATDFMPIPPARDRWKSYFLKIPIQRQLVKP